MSWSEPWHDALDLGHKVPDDDLIKDQASLPAIHSQDIGAGSRLAPSSGGCCC